MQELVVSLGFPLQTQGSEYLGHLSLLEAGLEMGQLEIKLLPIYDGDFWGHNTMILPNVMDNFLFLRIFKSPMCIIKLF